MPAYEKCADILGGRASYRKVLESATRACQPSGALAKAVASKAALECRTPGRKRERKFSWPPDTQNGTFGAGCLGHCRAAKSSALTGLAPGQWFKLFPFKACLVSRRLPKSIQGLLEKNYLFLWVAPVWPVKRGQAPVKGSQAGSSSVKQFGGKKGLFIFAEGRRDRPQPQNRLGQAKSGEKKKKYSMLLSRALLRGWDASPSRPARDIFAAWGYSDLFGLFRPPPTPAAKPFCLFCPKLCVAPRVAYVSACHVLRGGQTKPKADRCWPKI
jgi:hypothetical protein